MNKYPLISVIIPVYNVEKYLDRCLNSVEAQYYKNLEIILINDGSTDNSLKIAQKHAKSDKKIKIFTEKNKGLSAARNLGLSKAKGKYLTFIDSDDYVTKNYISYLYGLLKKNNFRSQLSICSLMDVYVSSGKCINQGNNKEYTLSGKECIKMMCYQKLVDTCAYAKLGSRKLYEGFSFPEGKLFEDIGSTYKLFIKAKVIECGFKPNYFYNIRDNSITTGQFNRSKLDLLEMTDKMAKNVVLKYPDLADAVLRRRVYARFSTLNQTIKSNDDNEIKDIRKELISFIMKYKKKMMSNPDIPKRDRVAYFCLSIGFTFYKTVWMLYCKINK